ncbi:predicted protein [Chaetomium globosum CBS 148.51]|uniref:Uncharacterized protein n=1 Tax=Chaetomium globosum (strain ATCC 6205 / CBS 148.51 / DSM 1962 / NBRC 6347 / NRRL 1970) TaxID=306901 RepID=Q2GYI8_CHAGB|nr:uncharacterized protein CHGG_06966 [Chaetomium globosum CBS 148.51]EAQ85713.1 predicted protein [Chaetomium globosum CBS 148.51]
MINVGYNLCLPAKYGRDIQTVGLDTCIGVVAYGLPSTQGGVNKVMAHASTGGVDEIIGQRFIAEVQKSRMTIHGICMSCPSPDRNNNGPDKLSDDDIRRTLAEEYGLHPSQVTPARIQQFRDGLVRMLQGANNRAAEYCVQYFGVNPTVRIRENRHVRDPPPYGTLVASASPGGEVRAEGHRMASIPNGTATAAPAAAAASSSRDSAPKRAPAAPSSSSKKPASASNSKKPPPVSSSAKKPPPASSSSSRHKSSSSRGH